MHLIWNKRAETDLWLHIGYIYEQSPQNAQKFLSEIETLVESLSNFPYKFPAEPIYNSENVRYAVIYSYKIIYHVDEDIIRILRIFHTKQNPKKV